MGAQQTQRVARAVGPHRPHPQLPTEASPGIRLQSSKTTAEVSSWKLAQFPVLSCFSELLLPKE